MLHPRRVRDFTPLEAARALTPRTEIKNTYFRKKKHSLMPHNCITERKIGKHVRAQ